MTRLVKIVDIQSGSVTRDGKTILQDIDLQLGKGDFIYITGKSGAGKTTLLSALYADELIQGTKALVAQCDLLNLTVEQLPVFRRKIGMVFQDFKLFDDKTVRSNLYVILQATGWKEDAKMKEVITTVLSWVGLEDKAAWMPGDLSGGEKQRLSIARALLNDPELIIADEPTGNLDPETSDQIIELLRRLTREKGVAVICATHDTRVIERYPSPIYQCEKGTLIK